MIYLLIPLYNEADNLPNLYKELSSVHHHDEVTYVFSDDGSSDASIERIHALFKDCHYQIVGDGTNHGPGYAFNTGFEWILQDSKHTDDVIVTLEADCTSDIGLLNQMIAIQKLGYDMVLASVYAQGGGFDKTTFIRKFSSAVANLLFRFLFNIKILTLSSFYRVYSIEIIRSIQKHNPRIISENGFICMLEILIKAIHLEAKLIEVPMVLHSSKRKGKSKMKVVKTTWEYFKFLAKVKFSKSYHAK